MYHQFKELAGVDITKEAMEVGPTCHYIMGGIRVDADTEATCVPGLFAAGEVVGGMHGANRLGGNSLSDLIVFGRRAGLAAASYVKSLKGQVNAGRDQAEAAATALLEPFTRSGNENPYAIHSDLQECMQALVGIIRTEGELRKALEEIAVLKQRLGRVRVGGGREFNPGWHLALDLHALLSVSEAVTLGAIERKESRGGHTRDDYPFADDRFGKINVVIRRQGRAAVDGPRADPRDARRAQAAPRGEKVMAVSTEVTMRVWRGDAKGGAFQDYRVESQEGMVVLDVIHTLQATQAGDLACRWNCKAGKCGSCSAEINGTPRLMCMTRMDTFTPGETITVAPMKTFPVYRDLATDVSFNYEKARMIPAFKPKPKERDGTRRMYQADVERSQEFRKCIECFMCNDVCHVIRDHPENKKAFAGPRFLMRLAELEMHPLDAHDRKELVKYQAGLGFCNITKCCTEVCPEHIKITDNALIPLKERIITEYHDPVVWVWRKLTGGR